MDVFDIELHVLYAGELSGLNGRVELRELRGRHLRFCIGLIVLLGLREWLLPLNHRRVELRELRRWVVLCIFRFV